MRFYNVVGIRIFAAVFSFCMLMVAPIRADFIITGANENVAAGSTAIVSFSISSNNPSQDQLAGFQLQLQITPTMGTTDVLQFSPTSPVYEQVDPYNNPNYVFYNNSFLDPLPFWDNTSSTVLGGPLDLANGGDLANMGYTSFSGNASYLLATVQIDATNTAVPDTYRISLVPSNGPVSPNDATYFQDANGNNINYTSTPAEITITPAVSGVPAPPSLALAGIGSLSGLLYSCWRNRRRILLG